MGREEGGKKNSKGREFDRAMGSLQDRGFQQELQTSTMTYGAWGSKGP